MAGEDGEMAENSIPGAAPAMVALLHAYLAARYRVRLHDGRRLSLAIGRPRRRRPSRPSGAPQAACA